MALANEKAELWAFIVSCGLEEEFERDWVGRVKHKRTRLVLRGGYDARPSQSRRRRKRTSGQRKARRFGRRYGRTPNARRAAVGKRGEAIGEQERGERMAKEVSMSTQRLEVATVTTAPEFRVAEGGKVYGDLRVSRGGAFWRSKGAQQYQHLTWEQLDQLFKAHGVARSVGEYTYTPPPPVSFDEF